MPQVTVYIRNEDLDKWKSVDKKTEFMHNALNGQALSRTTEPAARLTRPAFTPRPTCKNGHNLDKFGFNCLDKECKYGK